MSDTSSAHDLSFTALGGGDLPLSDFAGKAVLVVNTASECGYTPQYSGLQTLSDARGSRGLVVLGVPCNDFGAQEPGSESTIAEFCDARFGVNFPMTAKVAIVGADRHPFYVWIAAQLGEEHLPKWNFHKYLLDPGGALAGTWPSAVEPGSEKIAQAIDSALSGVG